MKAGVAILLGAALFGCGSTARRPQGTAPHEQTGGAGGAGSTDDANRCMPPAPALIRLAFPELVESARDLLGDELGDQMAEALELDRTPRAFPLLAASTEGTSITSQQLQRSDALAQLAGSYVREHFEATTACDADFDCVREYLAAFAAEAFRRPVTAAELSALLLTVDRAEALGVTPELAAEYGVYAVFASPHFLYRTEFGDPESDPRVAEIPLTDFELASELSFLVSGRAPDQKLRAAADAGVLSGAEGRAQELDRLLATPAAEQHLARVLDSYFGSEKLQTLVFDRAVYPVWSAGFAQAARVELEDLLASSTRGGPFAELLTSRRALLNPELAALYGVALSSPAAAPSDFEAVELPDTRAGLLTRVAFAAMTSYPERPGFMERSRFIRYLLLCEEAPSVDGHTMDFGPDGTPRQRAEYRLSQPDCRDCHSQLDPLALATLDLDALGQFRTEDASATLPDLAGGASVRGVTELSRALPATGLASCMSQRLLEYALSWGGRLQNGSSCWRDSLTLSGEESLADLLHGIVASDLFTKRSR